MLRTLACVGALAAAAGAQVTSSWPHDYPGKPSGDFSPEWQDCASFSVFVGSEDGADACWLA